MKKTAKVCFSVMAAFVVIVVILASAGRMREEKLRDQPLTLDDLGRLAAEIEEVECAEAAENGEAEPPEIEKAEQIPLDLPRQLARYATDEERRQYMLNDKSLADDLFGLAGVSPLGAIADAALLAAGVERGAAYERGMANLIRGNWEQARLYFTEYARHCEGRQQQQIFCRLTWLEDDPERAARYMELACAGGDSFCLWNAWTLSKITGSTELAEHYKSRLDKIPREPHQEKLVYK